MKKAFLLLGAGSLLALTSCRKDIGRFDGSTNPLESHEQVVEYHIPTYDAAYPPRFPFLFKKIYDPSGKTVKEIDCSFWDVQSPSQLFLDEFYHTLKVEQKGRMVYLINTQLTKENTPDTVARITLNNQGRPESCAASPALDPDAASKPAVTEYYTYKNDRVTLVKSVYNGEIPSTHPQPFTYTIVDTVHYDNVGNPISFLGNSYQYDYTKKPKQQFYCDDFMGGDEPFFLLEYLGYFPEVTCPVNLRTHVATLIFSGDLTNHQFDSKGRLISYDFYAPITITWK